MFEELELEVIARMKQSIDSIFSKEVESVKMFAVRPGEVIKYIVSLGGLDLNDFDTNGYQWDYWTQLEINSVKYTLSGDGFYDRYCTLSKTED